LIPVLLVGYKRVVELSELLRKTLESGALRVYIAIDAAKSDEVNSTNLEFESTIAKIANDFPTRKIEVWIRDSNLGSSLSVLTGIEWAFQFEDSLAILEDDLQISEQLLSYFSSQTKLFEIDKKILMVSGSNPFRGITKGALAGYSHYPVVWGWATTRKNWEIMRQGIFDTEISFEKSTKLRVKNFLITGKKRAQSQLIDAWDVPLAAFMRAQEYKCLIPNINLVSNIGFDVFATHTTSRRWPLGVEIEEIDSFEMNYSQNYDIQMESLVLGVKNRHMFSILKLKLTSLVKRKKVQSSQLSLEFSRIRIPRGDLKK